MPCLTLSDHPPLHLWLSYRTAHTFAGTSSHATGREPSSIYRFFFLNFDTLGWICSRNENLLQSCLNFCILTIYIELKESMSLQKASSNCILVASMPRYLRRLFLKDSSGVSVLSRSVLLFLFDICCLVLVIISSTVFSQASDELWEVCVCTFCLKRESKIVSLVWVVVVDEEVLEIGRPPYCNEQLRLQ